jgi:hypothetical protein
MITCLEYTYIFIFSGNPAGGNFRGAFGRFIFENTGLYQHILYEDQIDANVEKMNKKSQLLAINYIKGQLFKFIPVSIILKGMHICICDDDVYLDKL